MNGWT